MLGGAWLFLSIALLIPAAVLGEPALFLVAILFFFIGGLARVWSKYLFAQVEYSTRLSSKRAFHGDEVSEFSRVPVVLSRLDRAFREARITKR